MAKKKDPVAMADEFMKNGGEDSEGTAEPKGEAQPPKWIKFDELKPMVSALIESYSEQLSHIRPSSIGYAAFSKKKSSTRAKIYTMKPMFGLFSNIDYILSVHLEAWVASTISEKYVLILHELLHIPTEGFDDTSKEYRKTVDHDVQDFKFIVDHFGTDWQDSANILKKVNMSKVVETETVKTTPKTEVVDDVVKEEVGPDEA